VKEGNKRDPVRIGMMLRSFDEKGGIGVYAHNIVRELVERDERNEYFLYYRSAEHLGRHSDRPNVTERVVEAPNKAIWDQIAIPIACSSDRIDVLFHPKFTVPFLAPCKTMMVVHGADWFMPDQAVFYHPWDVRYVRSVMPLYFKKASMVLSVSELTTQNFETVLDLPEGKIRTVYFGPARHFARTTSPETLDRVRSRYALPDRFIFTLTKLGDRNRKNFRGIAEAYALYHASVPEPLPLVVGGKDCERLRELYDIPAEGYGADIVFPGWIDQQDLPAIYTLADLFLYASNLEAFPIPITEAMACGTPILTSDANGLREIAGDAAEFVDQTRPEEIAEGLRRVLADEGLRRELSRRSLDRSTRFSWERCGRDTLRLIESLAS
jgi:glycosyltransferase involved in cell wall biosynthesis